MENQVFFRRVRVNADSQKAVIICSDAVLETKTAELAGFSVGARTQQEVRFGILSLTDPKSGQTLTAKDSVIQGIIKKMKPGDPMPGFKFSASKVTDKEGNELDNLYWVEPA